MQKILESLPVCGGSLLLLSSENAGYTSSPRREVLLLGKVAGSIDILIVQACQWVRAGPVADACPGIMFHKPIHCLPGTCSDFIKIVQAQETVMQSSKAAKATTAALVQVQGACAGPATDACACIMLHEPITALPMACESALS